MQKCIGKAGPLLFGLSLLLLGGCGGDSSMSTASRSPSTTSSASSPPAQSPTVDPSTSELLLVGTTSQRIVEIDPRSGREIRVLTLGVTPAHIAAYLGNVYFGGWLERYSVPNGELSQIAFSDAYTISNGIAVSPAGLLFASNGWLSAGPGTPTGSNTSVVAFPDPTGQNPAGATAYLFGVVDDPSLGNAPLTDQQIGFTKEGRLLVVSSSGYGIYAATVPPLSSATCGVTMCSGGTLGFAQLVQDPALSIIRFATDGETELFVLHSTGNIDEDDLATGMFQRIFVSGALNNPIDMAMSREGSLFVLEKSGDIKAFSGAGKMIGSFSLPGGVGQPLSLAFCCSSSQ
jgi:hypothetical protein